MKHGKQGEKKKVRFEITADAGAKACVAGSFNNWTPLELKNNRRGKFSKILALPNGRHEYKFIVNGTWIHDAGNPLMTVNDLGSLNSIIEV